MLYILNINKTICVLFKNFAGEKSFLMETLYIYLFASLAIIVAVGLIHFMGNNTRVEKIPQPQKKKAA